MKHANSSEKKGFGIFNALLVYFLFSVVAYAIYQGFVYVMQQVDTSNDVENVGLATFVITMTLAGTSALLRYERNY